MFLLFFCYALCVVIRCVVAFFLLCALRYALLSFASLPFVALCSLLFLRLMAKTVDFVVVFDDGVRKRHYHETEKGDVIYFVVQLEVEFKGQWKVAIRYDCSHGFAHMDKYDIKGKRTKRPLNLRFESALTYGDWDINENWQKYKEEFLRGIQG